MARFFRLSYSVLKNRNRKHLFACKLSGLLCYLKLLFYYWILGKKKIVAISLIEHIGDIIANEPISREVRSRHPDSMIIWFVRRPYIELVKYNYFLDRVFSVFCLTSWISILNKFDFEAVYDLHFNGRSCKICNYPLAKENVNLEINGSNYLSFGSLLNAVCQHNKIEVSDNIPQMYLQRKIVKKPSIILPEGRFVTIHCSSNESIKDWEKLKWNSLSKWIIENYGLPVVELGTARIIEIKSDLYYNFCGKLSILQSAEVIKKAQLFIGIDSGPAHMANALGTPGVILLGEYYFGMKNYNPFSGNFGLLKNCRLVYSDTSVKNISVKNVSENIQSILKELSTL